MNAHILRAEEFMRRIIKTADGCWFWPGAKNKDGYGVFTDLTKNWLVHRYIWALIGNKLDTRLHLDHICRNRACANPSHLEQVTPQVNNDRRILGPKMTHCYRGHEFTIENTYINPNSGHRTCLQCRREYEYRLR